MMCLCRARRRVSGGTGCRTLLATALVLAAACTREEPESAPVDAGPEGDASVYDGIELPPFEPLPLSPPELTPLRPIPEEDLSPPAGRAAAPAPAPSARTAPAPAPASRTAPAPLAAPEQLPLDVLLRVPVAGGPRSTPPPLDLRLLREPLAAPTSPVEPDAIDRMRERLRLERRQEAFGPAGPRQGTISETEAGLRVPLDDSVSLEGGVRVDQLDEPGAEDPERKSTPRVGVEVRF